MPLVKNLARIVAVGKRNHASLHANFMSAHWRKKIDSVWRAAQVLDEEQGLLKDRIGEIIVEYEAGIEERDHLAVDILSRLRALIGAQAPKKRAQVIISQPTSPERTEKTFGFSASRIERVKQLVDESEGST